MKFLPTYQFHLKSSIQQNMAPGILFSLLKVRASLHCSIHWQSIRQWAHAWFHIQTSSIVLAFISLKVGCPFMLTILFHWRVPCTIKTNKYFKWAKYQASEELQNLPFLITFLKEQGGCSVLVLLVPPMAILPCDFQVQDQQGQGAVGCSWCQFVAFQFSSSVS